MEMDINIRCKQGLMELKTAGDKPPQKPHTCPSQ